MASGQVSAGLDAWGEAISAGQAMGETGLVDIFEQRRREARRGPGVLQVRSLANRGDADAARQLLQRLLAEDSQWQPLRSLQEQLDQAVAPPAPSQSPSPAPAELEPFTLLLNRASSRLQSLGHPLPEPVAIEDPGLDGAAASLEAWSRRLSDYEARYALA